MADFTINAAPVAKDFCINANTPVSSMKAISRLVQIIVRELAA